MHFLSHRFLLCSTASHATFIQQYINKQQIYQDFFTYLEPKKKKYIREFSSTMVGNNLLLQIPRGFNESHEKFGYKKNNIPIMISI